MMIWNGRFRTAFAMLQMMLAIMLVRFVPMRFWRRSLGALSHGGAITARKLDEAALREARRLSCHVVRGGGHFPFTVKCLPQAMVLQWQLRAHRIPGSLVIAALRDHQSRVQDPYHAWVELEGIMVLGNCERSDYAVLMTLTTEPA